jgi:hypothetical protein
VTTAGFQAIFALVGQNLLQIRWAAKRMVPTLAMLLLSALAPLPAALPTTTSPHRIDAHAADKAPEPAVFALIGGVLCLVGLRLRRRKE